MVLLISFLFVATLIGMASDWSPEFFVSVGGSSEDLKWFLISCVPVDHCRDHGWPLGGSSNQEVNVHSNMQANYSLLKLALKFKRIFKKKVVMPCSIVAPPGVDQLTTYTDITLIHRDIVLQVHRLIFSDNIKK